MLPKLPKLGDFDDGYKPLPTEFVDAYDTETQRLAEAWTGYPRRGPDREAVMGKKLALLLRQVPTPTCQQASRWLDKGIPLNVPTHDYPLKEIATGMNREERVRTREFLLKEVAKGSILGPFKYENQTHASVIVEGREKLTKLRGTEFFWTEKLKNLQEIGRPITNSKKSLLNKDYTKHDVECKLKRFENLVRDFRRAEAFAVCDFKAAYRQVLYEMKSWGVITYLFEGKLWIDTKITFGIVPGAGFFKTIPDACCELFTYKKWERAGTLKSRMNEIINTDGQILRCTQSFHVDDGINSTIVADVVEWIEFFDSLDQDYMDTREALEWPLGKIAVEKGVYCGVLHNVKLNRCRLSAARAKKASRLAYRLQQGLPPKASARPRYEPFKFTRNE